MCFAYNLSFRRDSILNYLRKITTSSTRKRQTLTLRNIEGSFTLSNFYEFVNTYKITHHLAPEAEKAFDVLINSLNEYFDLIENVTNEDIEETLIKWYTNATIGQVDIIRAKSEYFGTPVFSDIVINMNEEEAEDYNTFNGMCFAKLLMLFGLKIPGHEEQYLGLIQWYDFKNNNPHKLFKYDCPLVKIIPMYTIVSIDSIVEPVHVIPRFVKIKFGKDIIEVKPTHRNRSSRFLGVWINAFNNNSHIIQQLKDEISAIIKNISCRKGITDKMMIYLFNMLIIPIIEYRSQLYVIEENILDSLMAKFRSFFKNKLKFARTAPNAILETNWIYNLNNFIANQRQAKITNFILQINDTGILGRIMEIRFLNIQQQLLLENHPLYVIDYKLIQKIRKIKNVGFKYHFILNNIKLMIENKFSIAKNAGLLIEYNMENGPTPLRDVISDNIYIKNFNMLQENNLIFVDQITTLDKNYLLSIEEMELKRYTKLISTKRMSQEHRKSYERIIIDLSCSKISFKIKTQIHDNMLALDEIYNLKGTILLPATILPEKGATIVSRLTRGKFQNRTVFGRVIKTNVDNKIIYFNHFETLTDDFEKNIILRKCEGCELGTLNAEVFKKKVQSKCLIIERIDKHRLDNGRMIQYEVPISGDNIDKYLAKGNRYNISYQRIKRIKDRIKLDSSNNIHVYIDGSVINNGRENITSIFGITIYDDKERLIDKYFSTIEQWLTSTKAETMAFFVALLLINEDKNFIIYTDSSNVIKNYEHLTNKWLSTTTRDILKFDKNNSLWFNIKEILDSFTQQLDVIKVKSHSNNKLHNELDEEIRGWYDMEDRLANTLVIYNTEQYKFPIMWNNYIIEMNLRRFIRLLTRTQGLEKFLNLNRNWRYRLLDVKWEIVFSYINKQVIGETTYKTDKFICKQKRMKIQRLIEEIPTIEQMKKSSYEIYQDFKCVFCYKKKEDFHHVWTCRHNRKILKQIIKRTIDKLIRLLKEYGATVDENKILTDINKFDIFFPKFRKDKFNFIDLIKGIFPKQLYDYIEKLEVIGKKNIVSLGTELLQYVMDETKQHIWLPHCEKLKIIEKRHGITEKDKKKSDSNVGKEKQEDILQRPINLFGRYEDLEGVKEYILFGKEILDFTVVVNRVEKQVYFVSNLTNLKSKLCQLQESDISSLSGLVMSSKNENLHLVLPILPKIKSNDYLICKMNVKKILSKDCFIKFILDSYYREDHMLKHKDVSKIEGLGWIEYRISIYDLRNTQLSIEINFIEMVCSYLLIQINFLSEQNIILFFDSHSK
ncbi:kinase-like domain-containing protein [Rhizophagus irregularis DAOM 181602=DAOM 197198]|nr:kinase-like domain-containing protein [Rhizophagus irregularis DAOM 181602=DAOM 197198]